MCRETDLVAPFILIALITLFIFAFDEKKHVKENCFELYIRCYSRLGVLRLRRISPFEREKMYICGCDFEPFLNFEIISRDAKFIR